jgi:hypothetical protein
MVGNSHSRGFFFFAGSSWLPAVLGALAPPAAPFQKATNVIEDITVHLRAHRNRSARAVISQRDRDDE